MRGDFFDEAMQYRSVDLAAQRRVEEEIMSESETMPVLWTVGQTNVLGMGPWVVYADAEVIATTRREADARLIASAPDLLAALKRVACHVPDNDPVGRDLVRTAMARAEER